MSKAKILIVEDELVIALSIQKSLESLDYEVTGFVATGEEAVDKALGQNPDLILMDIILSGAIDGIEAARRIRKKTDIPIIYLTANADSATVDRARDTLPYGYLNKPVNERDLFTNIDSSIYKHRMELRIGESEQKYRDLIENINDIILTVDENGTITYASPQVYEVSGYKADEILGNNFINYIYPEDRNKVLQIYAESKTGVKKTGEYRVIAKSGDVVWLHTSGRPRFIEGRFRSISIILSDITKQKKAEEAAKKQEAFLGAVFDSIQDGISVLDSDFRIVRVNETMKKWYSHMLPLEGKRCYEAYHMRGERCEICPSSRAFETGKLEADIVPLIVPEGQVGWLEVFSFPMLGERGNVSGIVEYVRDITARENAEDEIRRKNDELMAANEELQTIIEEVEETNQEFEKKNKELLRTQSDLAHREALLQSIFRAAPTGIGMVHKRVISWTNKMLCTMTGYTETELYGQNARILYPTDEDYEYVGREKYAQIDVRGTGSVETRWKRKDGTIIDILLSSTPLELSNLDAGVVFTALDITELKRVEQALAETVEKYRLLAENIPYNMFVLDINTFKYMYTSPAITNILGYNVNEVFKLTLDDVIQPLDLVRVKKIVKEEIAKDGQPGVDPNRIRNLELEQIHKNGSIIATELTVKFLRDNDGKIIGILGISRDISERKRTQIALEESEKKFRMIIENSPIPICIMDNKTGNIIYLNEAITKIHGYTMDDISNITEWEEAAYPDPAYRKRNSDGLKEAIRDYSAKGRGFRTYEIDIRCKNDSYKRVEFQVMFMGDQTVFILNDLTEKKIQQEMMIQTEKMTSLGGMAAGMAHEINNPLGIILQGIQGALSRLDPGVKKNRETAVKLGTDLDTILAYLKERDILEYLNGIQDAGLRAAKIIINMLQFSRRSETSIAPVDINLLIDKTVEIASNDYDLKKKYDFKMIRIIREYDPKLPKVPCSETGIEQVVLNLLKNSSQAMATMKTEGYRPVITIETGMDGKYAHIKITDNGPGIEKSFQKQIFEPFYTTKGVGMGTGLGLSVSYHIIAKIHKGQISVESDAGKGATFTIKLPIKRPK
jgi:PAS domain S-box-containing protein